MELERDSIIIVGKGVGVSDLKKSWEGRGIEVTLTRDTQEAKKRINKTPYKLVGFEPDLFETFVSETPVPSISLKDFIEKRLHDFIKRFKASEGANLYYTLLREIEKPLITMVLKETGGNQLQAAHILGLNRNTLRKKIKELNIVIDSPAR
ncbi:MAG: helix-turn-helix domain-containing protein [Nitrospira sp.]|nr:helix-turn-helix domain-containing protein [Nitrospira sp.]